MKRLYISFTPATLPTQKYDRAKVIIEHSKMCTFGQFNSG